MEQCFGCARDNGRCYTSDGFASLRGLFLGALVGGCFAGWLGLVLGGGAGAVINTFLEGKV